MQSVPFETTAIENYSSKSDWDAVAADLVATMLERWQLTALEAFVGGEAGSVLRVATPEGGHAVLKVGFPHVEAIWEAVGLEGWGPGLAPMVLRQDAWTWSMLIEEVAPGTPLSRHGVPATEAVRIAAELFAALVAAPIPDGIPSLTETVRPFADTAITRLAGDGDALAEWKALPLVESALADLILLLESPVPEGFLHGDYNPGNVLLGADDRWRVIDPKPMRGDPAFDLAPLLSQLGSPWTQAQPARVLERQLEVAAAITGCDRERSARWAAARAALNVSWYLEDGDSAAARNAVRELREWRAVAS